jgi:hypothetical protein
MGIIRRVAVAGIFAPLFFSDLQPTHAEPVTENLGVEILSGPAAGETGILYVTYDTRDLNGDVAETLNPAEAEYGVELVMNLFGQTFTGENDTDFPEFPLLTFLYGELVFIDYVIQETNAYNPTPIYDPRIVEINGGKVRSGDWQADTFEAEAEEPVMPRGSWRFKLYRDAR